MYYSIAGFCPIIGMGQSGFMVKLYPGFKTLVSNYKELDQKSADTALKHNGRDWLDACGFDELYDPDETLDERLGFKEKRKPGPNARKLYLPETSLRVSWGEWGPEHIDVPGNACGLDLDKGISAPHDGRALMPHNVDTPSQATLLLIIFTWFAESLSLHQEILDGEQRMKQQTVK